MSRRTKIVATVGPASRTEDQIGALIDAGVSMFRFNLSHGTVEGHLEGIARVRKVAADKGTVIAVLADLPGPKIRLTSLGDDGVEFRDNEVIELKSGSEPSTAQRIYTDYPTCSTDLRVGDDITLGDGGVDLRVESIEGDVVNVKVQSGGTLRGRPGLHLPADRVTIGVPTDEDRMLIDSVALPGKVDFVAVSFVRNGDEIRFVRKLLGDTPPRIISKIETPAALLNLEDIVIESDAVMVARGDLGTECPLEDVPVYQKRIIRTCIAHATPVITATQMLESMITAMSPTRAEASDVANAVCDGTDAIMLSGESAVGHNPPLVVETMARIAERAEIEADYERFSRSLRTERRVPVVTAALTHAALTAANDANASAIICCTQSGSTVQAMATLRPDAKLIALSTSAETVNREVLTWGVIPLIQPDYDNAEEMVSSAVQIAQEAGLVQTGDTVAILSGNPGVAGSTDALKIMEVGQASSGR